MPSSAGFISPNDPFACNDAIAASIALCERIGVMLDKDMTVADIRKALTTDGVHNEHHVDSCIDAVRKLRAAKKQR